MEGRNIGRKRGWENEKEMMEGHDERRQEEGMATRKLLKI